MTNYEMVKQLSVEEMAEFLEKSAGCGVCIYKNAHGVCDGWCQDGIKQWLESEAATKE